MNLVYKLYETRKITVIMVLHDLNHAARYSHRLVAVKKGKIFAEGWYKMYLQKKYFVIYMM